MGDAAFGPLTSFEDIAGTTTGAVLQETFGDWAYDAVWVDDNRILVGQVDRGWGYDYWIIDLDDPDAEPELIVQDALSPAISPDGSQLAARLWDALVVVSLEDGRTRKVAEFPGSLLDVRLSWSPDGTRIMWQRRDTSRKGGIPVKVVAVEGGTPTQVAVFDLADGISWGGR